MPFRCIDRDRVTEAEEEGEEREKEKEEEERKREGGRDGERERSKIFQNVKYTIPSMLISNRASEGNSLGK